MGSRDGPPAYRRGACGAAVALLVLTSPVTAQRPRAVTLHIKPHVGDTLYTRFEQEVEMTGTAHVGDADTTMTMTSSMLMLSRVLVQGSDESGTTVTTVTDSVALVSTGMESMVPPDAVRRAMQGKRVRLRIAPDGSATVLDAPNELTPDLRAVVSGMPATLPDRPVAVGGSWEKIMEIPVAGQSGAGRAATLRTTYHLDSLSGDGAVAYISMRGTLTRDSTALPLPQGIRITSSGSITGTMRVDRRRGWWTDSRATIALTSILTPVAAGGGPPMHVRTTIRQRMRTGRVP